MERHVGMWIDHREAIIVRLSGQEAEIERVEADLDSAARDGRGNRSRTLWGPQDVDSERHRERRYSEKLHKYYQDVLGKIADDEDLLVVGPGQAKNEFIKEIERSPKHRNLRPDVQPTDHPTENQLVALVKEHFGLPTRITGPN